MNFNPDCNTDTRTLVGIRNVLTVKNKMNRLLPSGPLEPGTEKVRCLHRNSSGYYCPCLAYIVNVTKTGRITVDLWKDRSERVTVSAKAIVWPNTEPSEPLR